MSVDADTKTDLEAPVAVLDGLAIYDVERPFFDPERSVSARRSDNDRRVYLVAKLDVVDLTPGATDERRLLGLYATTDGQASIRLASDEDAQVEGLLAHSLVESTERLREPDAEARELLADRVADIGGIHQ